MTAVFGRDRKKSRTRLWLGIAWLLVLFLLSACRNEAAVETLTAVSPVPPLATVQPSPTITAVPTNTPPPLASPLPTTVPPTPEPLVSPTPAFPVYTGPPLDQQRMGIQVHIHREDLTAIFDHARILGAGWIKTQVSWKLYQPEPDRFDTDRFAELDRFVRLAGEQNMAVLLSVSKAPEWSRPTTEMDGPPSDFALFGTFMAQLAARYQGQVAAYELWNEPNLQREWNGRFLDASDLVALIRVGAAGVRENDPAALLISSGPATTGINDRIIAIDDRLFMREMLAAGVGEIVDGIGVHPYGWANPPDSTFAQPDTAVTNSHNNHPSFFFLDTLNDYRSLLEEFGVDRPLWVTEFGWGSFDQLGADPPPGVSFMADVDEWQQALYIMRAFELGQEKAWIGPLFLWNLNFGQLLGPDYTETGFGIIRPDGTPRPVYWSLSNAGKQ